MRQLLRTHSAHLLLLLVLAACGGDGGEQAPSGDAVDGPPASGAAPAIPGDGVPAPGETSQPADVPGGLPASGDDPAGEEALSQPPVPESPPAGAVDAPGITAPPGPPGQEATAILTRASARLAALRGFCGDFRQEIRIPLLGQTTRSAGRLCQQRPNLFEMDFSDPEGDRVVADGEWVWTYFPSTDPRQVVRFPLAEQGRMDFFQEFVSEPGVRYAPTLVGQETVGGRSTWRISLEPRDRSYFEGATVWIDRETTLMRKVEILQENGSVRVVELGDLELDPAIPPGRFSFTPPEGTQVFTPPPAGGAR